MTLLLEKPRENTAEMSVVDRKFSTEEEVNTLIATAYLDHSLDAPAGRRARPHGLDRVVLRLSLTMLIGAHKRGARKRAERAAVSHDERAQRVSQARAIERREHDAALRVARVR